MTYNDVEKMSDKEKFHFTVKYVSKMVEYRTEQLKNMQRIEEEAKLIEAEQQKFINLSLKNRAPTLK